MGDKRNKVRRMKRNARSRSLQKRFRASSKITDGKEHEAAHDSTIKQVPALDQSPSTSSQTLEAAQDSTIKQVPALDQNLSTSSQVLEAAQDSTIKQVPASDQSPSTSSPKLPAPVTGRRIVDICHLWNEFCRIASHNPFSCSANSIVLKSELRRGMCSLLQFECSMCNTKFSLTTEPAKPKQGKDINFACVKGTMSIGSGFAHFEELTASMNIPCMNEKSFSTYQDEVARAWHQTALEEMKKAAAEERRLAIENGDVHEDGVPFITVVVDGAWSKRSYKTKYNALSGVGVIIGHKTKKVLYLGVRNKFCVFCARAEKGEVVPSDHHCNKNWNGPSTAMEADIILEGFMKSVELYGLRYTMFIGDGDSSVYRTLLEARPYGDHQIQKIWCRNHILRNYSAKLRKDMYDPKKHNQSRALRCLVKQQERRLRAAVVGAIFHRSKEQGPLACRTQKLRDDILNSPNHIFDDHSRCDSYFCDKPREGRCNMVPELKKSGVYDDLMNIVEQVAKHAPSLIHNVDSNIAELFFSIVTKFIGGKRINFSLGNSYTARCYGAVVSFNSGKLHSATLETAFSTDSDFYTKKLEIQRETTREFKKRWAKSQKASPASKKRRQLKYDEYPEGDEHYGPYAETASGGVIPSDRTKDDDIPGLIEEVIGIKEREFQYIQQVWSKESEFQLVQEVGSKEWQLQLNQEDCSKERELQLIQEVDSKEREFQHIQQVGSKDSEFHLIQVGNKGREFQLIQETSNNERELRQVAENLDTRTNETFVFNSFHTISLPK